LDLKIRDNVIPQNDDTTLFVCSGMQDFKNKFIEKKKEKFGTIQSCIRTNDMDLIGDGTHLTYFQMIGNFSFGNNDYEKSIYLWHDIMQELNIPIDYVTVHPTQKEHEKMWKKLNYDIIKDEECVWSDGEIGGYCCEMFCGELEVGNLVNTLGHSSDVGFGLERILQIMEGKSRVDETSLFDVNLNPILRDHVRCLKQLYKNNVKPGNTKENYTTRKLIRRSLRINPDLSGFIFDEWLEQEKEMLKDRFKIGKKLIKKHSDKNDDWWWETTGLLPEEVQDLRESYLE
jgi:alanyl-tRNA synthetase